MKAIKKNIVLFAGVVGLSLGLTACGSHQHKTPSEVQNEQIQGRYDTNPYGNASGHSVVGQAEASSSAAANGLRNVFYFGFDEDSLTSQARSDLQAQANYLQGEGGVIRLEGHADEQGSRQYNMALGERRAQAVASYLRSLGVNASRFEIVSYGEEKPAATGGSERAHSLNRRVELK